MRSLVEAWRRFWFAPQSTAPLGIVRIFYGLLMVGWTLSLLPDLVALYSSAGMVPAQPGARSPLTLLAWWDSPTAVAVLWAVMLLAAVSLMVGAWTRVAAVALFVLVLSFQRRSPDALNSGDVLLRLLGFYLALAPSGAALSLDRWRRHRDTFWVSPRRSPWALRLIQVQVSVLYLSSVFFKVRSDHWADGTAMYYITQLSGLERLPVPDGVSDSLVLMNLLTYGSLAIELALGVLIWNRRALPWVLAGGVALHLGIEITMLVGFFSLGIFVSYLAFIPPDVADRALHRVRRRVGRRRSRHRALEEQPV